MYDHHRAWDSGESDDDFDIDDLFETERHSHYSFDYMGLMKGLLSSLAGVAILVLVIYCCCRRKRRNAGRVLTNPPPPPPGPNTLPAAAYPRQEYAPQPEAAAPYPHVAAMQSSPYPAAPYPGGHAYPYPAQTYPAQGYPAQSYPAQSYPAQSYPAPYAGPVYPTAPSAPEHTALPPSYDQAVGEKHPPCPVAPRQVRDTARCSSGH